MPQRSALLMITVAVLMTGMSCMRQPERPGPSIPVAEDGSGGGMADASSFRVRLETTKGDIVLEVNPSWAPEGARRFRDLVEAGFYNDCAFFRVLDGFMCQVGMNGDPNIQARWADRTIPDDPVRESNRPGYVTFAKTGAPDSRSTQFFINYGNNASLDRQGFAPFGRVVEGMDVALKINSQYGETPDQGRIRYEGNTYLKAQFPRLDYIRQATIVHPGAGAEPDGVAAPGSDASADGNGQTEPGFQQ